MELKEKDSVYIQSFKHDGSLHRTWATGYVIEANDQRIVAVTDPRARFRGRWPQMGDQGTGSLLLLSRSLVQCHLHDPQGRGALLLQYRIPKPGG